MKTCIDCGARIASGSRCATHDLNISAVYGSALYRSNRAIRMQYAGGRCERILPNDGRCPEDATEAHHTVPLATARSIEEALELSDWRLLEAVCSDHNPRGG